MIILIEEINKDLNNITNIPAYKEFKYNDNNSKIGLHKELKVLV